LPYLASLIGSLVALFGFGAEGWGRPLLLAALMTISVSAAAFGIGLVFGLLGAWGKLSASLSGRAIADAYTTVLRGVPDLLVVYLFYFGGSAGLTAMGHLFGATGFFGLPGFAVGAIAIGIVSGAYQTEVLRGAYQAIPDGELEAARSVGMGSSLMLRRIIVPQGLRTALPGMANVWQSVLKESALVSITGLTEIMRQVEVGSQVTRRPFDFFVCAALLYLILTSISGAVFYLTEARVNRGMRA
jgi:octopine/nopaline transport system permease protein